MAFREETNRAWTIAYMTLKNALVTRKGLVTIIVSYAPVYIIIGLLAAQIQAFDVNVFQQIMGSIMMQVVLVFVSLVYGTSLLRDEIEDNTLVYLTTRPVVKPLLVLYKYSGYIIAALMVLLPPVAISYFAAMGGLGQDVTDQMHILSGLLLVMIVGAVAYGAFFLMLGILLKKPLTVGLMYAFVWEFLVSILPGEVPKLSVIYYLRSIAKNIVAFGPLHDYPSSLTLSTSLSVPLAFAAASLVLAIFTFFSTEFKETRE